MDELSEQEKDFFAAIDRNGEFEASVFGQIENFTDEQYYTLQNVHVEHTCGVAPTTVEVYAERAGTLYRCTRCGQSGTIAN